MENALSAAVDAALDPDRLLTTTRAVRRRLDLTRPVARADIEACLAVAQQAPSGGNQQDWGFVVVTDPARKLALADLYRRARAESSPKPGEGEAGAFLAGLPEAERAAFGRMMASAAYLAEHLHEVPVLVVPTVGGAPRTPVSLPGRAATFASWVAQAVVWGGIAPAIWSFMLAARARGLGTCWTTLHLHFEEEAAAILGIPFPEVAQAALIPVAHVVGDPFKPARRGPVESIIHWEQW
jgi:nitroreductase